MPGIFEPRAALERQSASRAQWVTYLWRDTQSIDRVVREWAWRSLSGVACWVEQGQPADYELADELQFLADLAMRKSEG
ncbi:hypothetical protein [Ectothiorhodospira mobilis]|uniref:hypothetical protein n=1 Tax=Ectothiorhodospira mobilis TaxID=195064 RepID=UPI0019058A2B|nr:hypothetical protein [Ectothiorhodospira mobilis]MBK1691003.1 hypothetical protein [Ectothiorhodospira mobilis]